MAFDFLSYIVDQTQQNSQLFVNQDKLQRKSIISHIVSLQLMYFMGLSSKTSYQNIKTPDENLADVILPQHKRDEFAQHLHYTENQIKNANQQILNILLTELKQLNENAQLGESGIKELLDGQLPWIQQQVDDWFWIFINQTEHKITKTNKQNSPDLNQIMRDFNQIILNKEQLNDAEVSTNNMQTNQNTSQNSSIVRFLNPIIALIILCFLHNIIL